MADDDRRDAGDASGDKLPDLELPSLRSAFRWRRRAPAEREATPEPTPAAPTQASVAQATQEPPAEEPSQRRRARRPVRIRPPGPLAAAVTGGLVGLALVGLTSASRHLCSSMRGTSSCGKPGILLLLVITAALVLVGALLLRLAGVGSPGSTSFLGVGLLVVLILLVLLPVLDDGWVVVVVPLLAMLTYLASWWVTTTYVEPGERMGSGPV